MRVEYAVLRNVEMPLKFRFRTSFGEMGVKKFVLLELHGEGLSRWGECVAEEGPFYAPETIASATQSSEPSFCRSCSARWWARPRSSRASRRAYAGTGWRRRPSSVRVSAGGSIAGDVARVSQASARGAKGSNEGGEARDDVRPCLHWLR